MFKRRAVSLLIGVAAFSMVSCVPERLRPGPPNVSIDIPNNGVVTSPDTIVIRVTAQDADGLDSVTVTFLRTETELQTDFGGEVSRELTLIVPRGFPTGFSLPVRVRAKDLEGEATVQSVVLSVENN